MLVLKLITLPVFLLLSAIAAYIFFDNKIDSLTRRVTRCKHCKSEKINYLHWPVERKSGGGETLKYDWKEIKKNIQIILKCCLCLSVNGPALGLSIQLSAPLVGSNCIRRK